MNRHVKNPLNEELQKNLEDLLEKVNKFRDLYGKPLLVSSGYRPATVNASTPGAAKKSAHMSCQAVDFADKNGEIKKFITEHLDVLEKCDLYMELPTATPTWCHLQIRKTSKRIFIP